MAISRELLQQIQKTRSSSNINVMIIALTLMSLAKEVLYIRRYSTLMLSRSTSHLVTMMKINWLSLVPIPFIESRRRSAKYAARFLTHFTAILSVHEYDDPDFNSIQIPFTYLNKLPMASNASSISPLNSDLMDFSISCPETTSYL